MEMSRFKVLAETGIMSRPATRLVMAAQNYASDVTLTYNGKTVNLKSIMGVMSLGIPQDSYVEIQANGEDEQEAMAGIVDYLKSEGVVEQVALDAN
ncbi:phosphocarrier protein HPr [Lentilactobacillus otakiensis]|jgi:phosphocarrier protein HPr|uniref:Phosphocarrier protein HPr n=1 Tax=Lentilactobacillus otakiensis DSM 19908 = JCM 15040 TaxID=1423780 RepID=S4PPD6_9LACO|nr:phosphocarrier protein HPr [Lentilactobacillus otakiensis]MBZ3777288.1 phosphocarrier protein HPr [Lentilactobacillus otakiensis]MDV3518546.1 phosphocarrier protein HPr [Lentilactobacillus otakiensis]GAD16400.1 phosphocarrier protein HPr [Lentilactobacillus otakiensis DSM 19908 = JCM 15040]